MNTCYIQTLADGTIKTVGVRFINNNGTSTNRVYTYKTRLDLKRGDLAIVNTPNGFAIVKVTRVDAEPQIDPNSTTKYKWILQKVDEEGYEKAWKVDAAFAREIKVKQREVHRAQAKAALAQMFGEGVDITKTLETVAANEDIDFDEEDFEEDDELM